MSKIQASRVRYLRLALQEAVRCGDRDAEKRLTARVLKLMPDDTNLYRSSVLICKDFSKSRGQNTREATR